MYESIDKIAMTTIKIILMICVAPLVIICIPIFLFFAGTFGSFTKDIVRMMKGTYKY